MCVVYSVVIRGSLYWLRAIIMQNNDQESVHDQKHQNNNSPNNFLHQWLSGIHLGLPSTSFTTTIWVCVYNLVFCLDSHAHSDCYLCPQIFVWHDPLVLWENSRLQWTGKKNVEN